MNEIIAVITITIIAVISPGADFAMVTRNSISNSRRVGFFTALGISLGVLVHVTYSILGIGLIISNSIILFNLIKIVGAIYLIYCYPPADTSPTCQQKMLKLAQKKCRVFQPRITNIRQNQFPLNNSIHWH